MFSQSTMGQKKVKFFYEIQLLDKKIYIYFNALRQISSLAGLVFLLITFQILFRNRNNKNALWISFSRAGSTRNYRWKHEPKIRFILKIKSCH